MFPWCKGLVDWTSEISLSLWPAHLVIAMMAFLPLPNMELIGLRKLSRSEKKSNSEGQEWVVGSYQPTSQKNQPQ